MRLYTCFVVLVIFSGINFVCICYFQPATDEGGNVSSDSGVVAVQERNEHAEDTEFNAVKSKSAAKTSLCKQMPFNHSQSWLDGPRLGNIIEADNPLTVASIRDLILPSSSLTSVKSLLQQSICHEKSRFLDMNDFSRFEELSIDKTLARTYSQLDAVADKEEMVAWVDLAFKLVYLAIHDLQHAPARAEAMARFGIRNNACSDVGQELYEKHGVGKFDYECPDAKYLVSTISSYGWGASTRSGILRVIFFGLITNRVVLFLNSLPDHLRDENKKNVTEGGNYSMGPLDDMTLPWNLASCKRKDMQCFYMPMSPCVLTEMEVARAPRVLASDISSGEFRDEKVLILTVIGNEEPTQLRDVLNDRIMAMFGRNNSTIDGEKGRDSMTTPQHHFEQQNGNTKHGPIVVNLTSTMVSSSWPALSTYVLNGVQEVLYGTAQNRSDMRWMPEHAAAFYVMRPNMEYHKRMNALMGKIVPSDFDAERSLGIAIRSSDKCLFESECLSFDQYMDIAKRLSQKAAAATTAHTEEQNAHMIPPLVDNTKSNTSPFNYNYAHDTLVLTSESLQVLEERHKYSKNDTFPFRFLINSEDAGQGTGDPSNYKLMEGLNVSADDIMMSTIMAIKMQLLAKITIGNCCSNFFWVITEFVINGCSASRDARTECLQANENPEYHLCCYWDLGQERCKNAKARQNPTDLMNTETVEERTKKKKRLITSTI